MTSFKGAHFPKDVILYAVFFYVRYGVSYRDLEAIMEERGVKVDHSTLNRWVINYSSSLALAAKKIKRAVATSWRMDETYIKVKGQWVYLYRAVDKFGDTVDFILSERRDEAAATAFFKQAIDTNGFPNKVVMDKSGANCAGLENINMLLMLAGLISFVEILQVKYLPVHGIMTVVLASKIVRNPNYPRQFPLESRIQAKYSLCIALAVMACLLSTYAGERKSLHQTNSIPAKYAELLTIAPQLNLLAKEHDSTAIVLNEFNYGGWIELAIYLSNRSSPRSADSSLLRTSIDGRTLVMGQQRLREYKTLTEGKDLGCEILSHWKPDYAILGKNSPLLRYLEVPYSSGSCKLCAFQVLESSSWKVYRVKGAASARPDASGSKTSCLPADISNLEITPKPSSTTDSAWRQ